MAESIVDLTLTPDAAEEQPLVRKRSAWRNLLGFALKRLALLALTVVSAVYLTIVIANYGGYIDVMVNARIDEQTAFMVRREPLASMPHEERVAAVEAARVAMKEEAGLNDPFFLRTLGWLGNGLMLDWGRPTRWQAYTMSTSTATVGEVIYDNLSRSLLVFGVANLLLFGVSVLVGLYLSRRRGGFRMRHSSRTRPSRSCG